MSSTAARSEDVLDDGDLRRYWQRLWREEGQLKNQIADLARWHARFAIERDEAQREEVERQIAETQSKLADLRRLMSRRPTAEELTAFEAEIEAKEAEAEAQAHSPLPKRELPPGAPGTAAHDNLTLGMQAEALRGQIVEVERQIKDLVLRRASEPEIEPFEQLADTLRRQLRRIELALPEAQHRAEEESRQAAERERRLMEEAVEVLRAGYAESCQSLAETRDVDECWAAGLAYISLANMSGRPVGRDVRREVEFYAGGGVSLPRPGVPEHVRQMAVELREKVIRDVRAGE